LLLVEQHRSDRALDVLANHRFKPWEGGQSAHEVYVLANLERGRDALQARNFELAEKSFRAALDYPVNLGVGRPDQPHDEEANYWLGVALSSLRKNDVATEAWRTAVKGGASSQGRAALFTAAALSRLGNTSESGQIFSQLAKKAAATQATADDICVAGLSERFSDKQASARELFQQALQRQPGNLCARIELGRKDTISELTSR
jgi:tetratricopeptide (TPR) repeat protein